jgi:pilus assembly protein Flp/PilA
MPEPAADTALPPLTNPFLACFVQDESGQDVIEYALVAAMVALGSVSGTANLAGTIADSLTGVSNTLSNATSVSNPATPPAPSPPTGGRAGRNGGGGNSGGRGRHHHFF